MSFPTKLTNLSQSGLNLLLEKLNTLLIAWQSIESVN